MGLDLHISHHPLLRFSTTALTAGLKFFERAFALRRFFIGERVSGVLRSSIIEPSFFGDS